MKTTIKTAPNCAVTVQPFPCSGSIGLTIRDGAESITQYMSPDQVSVLCDALRISVDLVQPRPDLGAMPTPDELAQALAA